MARADRVRTSFAGLVLALAVAQACSASSAPAIKQEFTIAAGSTNISLAPNASTTTFVKATRTTSYEGPIEFGINATGGLAIGLSTTNVPDSARVDIATNNSPPGSYSFMVTASGPEAITQQLRITVAISTSASVSAPTSRPASDRR